MDADLPALVENAEAYALARPPASLASADAPFLRGFNVNRKRPDAFNRNRLSLFATRLS